MYEIQRKKNLSAFFFELYISVRIGIKIIKKAHGFNCFCKLDSTYVNKFLLGALVEALFFLFTS